MFEFEGKKYEIVEGCCGDCAFSGNGCVKIADIWDCTKDGYNKIAKLVEE